MRQRPIVRTQNAPPVFGQHFTVCGDGQCRPLAIQQCAPQLRLQPFDFPTDRRLAEIKLLRRSGHAAGVNHAQ